MVGDWVVGFIAFSIPMVVSQSGQQVAGFHESSTDHRSNLSEVERSLDAQAWIAYRGFADDIRHSETDITKTRERLGYTLSLPSSGASQ